MVVALGTVAHNVLVWACAWLAPSAPRLASYGLVRLARDVVTISGVVLLDPTTGRLCRLVLNVADPVAAGVTSALRALLAPAHVAVTLGEP